MKTCGKCNKTFSLDRFHKRSKSPDGHADYCKGCKKTYDDRTNANRMFVNGQYVSKRDPRYKDIWKAGHYESWMDLMTVSDIKEKVADADIYIVSNPAWNSWYKVGKALNADDRVKSYQTSSPLRDYQLIYFDFFEDYSVAEAEIHTKIESHPRCLDRRNEWFYTDIEVIKQIMKEYQHEKASTRHRDQHSAQRDLGLRYT